MLINWNRVAGSMNLMLSLLIILDFFGDTSSLSIVKIPKNEPKVDVYRRNQKRKICETKDCVQSAAQILQYMDPSVDPCDDFYGFACGNFVKTVQIPDDRAAVDQFSTTNQKLQQQLKSTFGSEIQESDSKVDRLVKTYYAVCMNEARSDEVSEGEYKQLIEKLGGWPVVLGDSWKDESFEFTKFSYKLAKNGFLPSFFVSARIDVDDKNNDNYIAAIDQPSLGLSREYLIKGEENEVVQAYYSYMVDLAVIFGADRKRAETEMLDVLRFESKLANISWSSEQRRNPNNLYNLFKASELKTVFPGIPWLEFFNTLLEAYDQISDDENILIYVPSYLNNLDKLLKTTSTRTQANFALWRLTKNVAGTLSQRIIDRNRQYTHHLNGVSVKPPRWRTCVSEVVDNLDVAASYSYVKNHFDENAKKNAESLILNLRESFKGILTKSEWMEAETKKAALKKLENIRQYIAYPDELLDESKLDEYYKELSLDEEGSYYANKLQLRVFFVRRSLRKYRDSVSNHRWVGHSNSAVVNAFYDPSENSIEFPAGILQDVFFKGNNPQYLNYGAIGQVMGHEITHGFDDQGSEYDDDGKLINWWQVDTKKRYLDRAQCVIEQYNSFKVEEIGLNINGINTQGENIADIGGVKEAYYAYEAWEKKNGVEPSLPGLNYTSRQLFWIAGGTIWCEKMRPESQIKQVLTDPHAPGKYRVIGQVSNTAEFARDFGCPLGSNMYPRNTCTVW